MAKEHIEYNIKRIYNGKLDINYFIECVKETVQDAEEGNYLNDIDLKTRLERIKYQVYGLRDVFYIFDYDDIRKIAEPVEKALQELE